MQSNGGIILPVSFLDGLEEKIPIYCLIDEEGKVVDESNNQVTYSLEQGKYNVSKNSSCKFVVHGKKERVLQIITEIIINQMKRASRFFTGQLRQNRNSLVLH